MSKKGAMELSVNFLVIIIISIAILGGGIALFMKLRSNAGDIVGGLDDQVQQQIKSLMLSNNYNVAAWPNQLTLSPKKSQLIGIGITNTHQESRNFFISTDSISVMYYPKPENSGTYAYLPDGPNPEKWVLNTNIRFNRDGQGKLGNIKPGEQGIYSILLTVPDKAKKGEYVITFKIKSSVSDCAGLNCIDHGVTKVYVAVP